jgi:hypothetical protein
MNGAMLAHLKNAPSLFETGEGLRSDGILTKKILIFLD